MQVAAFVSAPDSPTDVAVSFDFSSSQPDMLVAFKAATFHDGVDSYEVRRARGAGL